MKLLVLGGGFAGRLLAWFLCRNGADVSIADFNDPYSATRVSAGIIKPVTGRRIVKTSKADEAIPFAFSTYRELSEISGIDILRNKPVLQLFNSQGNLNDWMARSSDPDMEGAAGEFIGSGKLGNSVHAPFGGVVLNNSGYAEPGSFQKAIDSALYDKCEFYQTENSEEEPIFDGSIIHFVNQKFDKAILCQGPKAVHQPLTSWIPFKPVKGEILDASIDGLIDDYILSAGIYVVPFGDGFFRIGSTYEWNDLSNEPTEKARTDLIGSLSELIRVPFNVIGQKAGVRPAIADRRPVIGWLPGNDSIGVFNGLGTKGAMLGPYYASQAADYFLMGTAVDADVDLIRFSKFYQLP
jgi:glycine oxidase